MERQVKREPKIVISLNRAEAKKIVEDMARWTEASPHIRFLSYTNSICQLVYQIEIGYYEAGD